MSSRSHEKTTTNTDTPTQPPADWKDEINAALEIAADKATRWTMSQRRQIDHFGLTIVLQSRFQMDFAFAESIKWRAKTNERLTALDLNNRRFSLETNQNKQNIKITWHRPGKYSKTVEIKFSYEPPAQHN